MSEIANHEIPTMGRLPKYFSARAIRVAAISSLFVFSLFLLSPSWADAQQPDDAPDGYPPPLKIIPKDEKNRLSGETDPKRHTVLALELTDTHLAKAEELNAKNDFAHMYAELGAFNAVIDEVLQFIARNDDGGGRILNSSKRLEIGLRSYAPRLETIRRDLPSNYEPYVKSLIKTIRDARSKAVEPFFGTSVVPHEKNN
jgi:hypothetical protein